MKITLWVVGIVLGLFLALGILQTLASERVEVVQLHTLDTEGNSQTTRLWIVDHKNFSYLRGEESSGWVTRLKENGQFELTRNEDTRTYTYTVRTDKMETINQQMREKYTWGDQFFEMMLGGRENSLPIELHEVSD